MRLTLDSPKALPTSFLLCHRPNKLYGHLSSTVLLSLLCWGLSTTETASPAEFGDIELSGYAMGSWPRDQNIFNQGTSSDASVQQGFGVGVKVGLFPSALHGIMGMVLDSNLHNGALSFLNIAHGETGETGRSDLLISNTTFNLILRYPGETIHPYIGVGAGWSTGMLLNPNIAGRDDRDFDAAYAFVHQFLGGAQVFLTPKVFLFSEYRFASSTYHWDRLAIDFRTHYGLLGAGLRF